jgi:hypothetical protein
MAREKRTARVLQAWRLLASSGDTAIVPVPVPATSQIIVLQDFLHDQERATGARRVVLGSARRSPQVVRIATGALFCRHRRDASRRPGIPTENCIECPSRSQTSGQCARSP